MNDFITFAVQQNGPARSETFQGRPHRVIPAVLVQSQVLHNNLGRTFLPPEEITDAWAATFNGAPVLIDHPKERGAPVAARNNRKVQDRMGVGFIDNAVADGTKVKGEVWLDEGRKADVGDLSAILARLDAGEPNELSTGFPLREREAVNGQHDGRDYDMVIRPGAGDHLAVFAAKRGACSLTDGCGLGVNHDGACDVPDVPEKGEADGKSWPARMLNAFRAFLSEHPDLTPDEPGTSQPDPATNADDSTPQEGDTMNREHMIAQLAEAGPLEKEALNKLSDCQLRALMGSAEPSDPPVSNAGPSDPNDETWQSRAQTYRRELDDLKTRSEPALNREKEERADLLDDLLYKGRSVAWSEQELKGMGLPDLRKVHRQVFNAADFSGRGGPKATTVGAADLSWCAPINEALTDRKEAN